MNRIVFFICLIALVYSCKKSDVTSRNLQNLVTDVDGNTYQAVLICNQNWTAKNLNVTHFSNGDTIYELADTLFGITNSPAWCWVYQDSTIYGKLYNWYAVNDPRGLAPIGWHIPSDSEWTIMQLCLGGNTIIGSKIKEQGFAHWAYNTTGLSVSNSSGFTALPGGRVNCRPNGTSIHGFDSSRAYFGTSDCHSRRLDFNTNNIWEETVLSQYKKNYGYVLRCVQD